MKKIKQGIISKDAYIRILEAKIEEKDKQHEAELEALGEQIATMNKEHLKQIKQIFEEMKELGWEEAIFSSDKGKWRLKKNWNAFKKKHLRGEGK